MTCLMSHSYQVMEPGSHLCSLNSKPLCFLSIRSTIFHNLNGDNKSDIYWNVWYVSPLPLYLMLLLYNPSAIIPILFRLGFGGPQKSPKIWLFSLPPLSASEFCKWNVNAVLELFYRKFCAQSWWFSRDSHKKHVTVMSSYSNTKHSLSPKIDESVCAVLRQKLVVPWPLSTRNLCFLKGDQRTIF